jgi:hypothetical protein
MASLFTLLTINPDEYKYTVYPGKIRGKTPKLRGLAQRFHYHKLQEAETKKAQLQAAYPAYDFFIAVNPLLPKETE